MRMGTGTGWGMGRGIVLRAIHVHGHWLETCRTSKHRSVKYMMQVKNRMIEREREEEREKER